MHYETRETRYTVIFMCTLTKLCLLYAVRGGQGGHVGEKRPVRRWRKCSREKQASHHYWSLDCDGELLRLWPRTHLLTLVLKASTHCVSQAESALRVSTWRPSEMQDSQESVVSVMWLAHCSATWATVHAYVGSHAVEASDRVWRRVSCMKPRLPCPCDPYGHCQRPRQGWAPYQLSGSHWWRRGEKKGEGSATLSVGFARQLLFYLGVFADHSSDWPRNVTVLCGAERTPDSAMEASDFRWKRRARSTGPLTERGVKCCTTVGVN